MFSAGDVVTPQGPPGEIILGLVLAAPDGWLDVLWLSDTRGVFRCLEVPSDVNLQPRTEDPGPDAIDGAAVARLIAGTGASV